MQSKLKSLCLVSLLSSSIALASSRVFTVLATFTGPNGIYPGQMALVQGFDGSFYGTTGSGGAYGQGTVFKFTPSGTLTTLYSFCAQSGCPDGSAPYEGLVLTTNGTFYGTTHFGGANGTFIGGYGTIFKVTSKGVLTTLQSFDGSNGYVPDATLVQAHSGDFYGTTQAGGVEYGVIFKVTPAGVLTTLHAFGTAVLSYGGLAQATDGSLYGTTSAGGAMRLGGIFKVTSLGAVSTIYSFNGTDGELPEAGLVQAADGYLYGTTQQGGAYTYGTIFKTTENGALTSLYSFGGADGTSPSSALVQAADGNFYGTTYEGGANGFGTVFEFTSGGALLTLHSFDSMDGAMPLGALVEGTDGNFYGTATVGGASGYGTVFRLSPGLAPFVKAVPGYAKVGATINILGTNLTGATGVAFNGTAAAFTIVSPTLITTTVPASATSGKIQVTTPRGTLSGNVRFLVLK